MFNRFSMKQIWLVRHAQSLAQTGCQPDSVDADLSEEGELQASALKSRLAGLRPDVILVSTMRRTQKTFILSGAAAPVMRADSRVIESDWGIGPDYYRSLTGIRAPMSRLLLPDTHDAAALPVDIRIDSVISEIEASDFGSYLIFSHCGFCSRFISRFLSVEPESWTAFKMDNTRISRLQIEDDGKRKCSLWNSFSIG